MSEDKVLDAVQYANGSNNLEDLGLTQEELSKLVQDIKSGVTEESFLYSVVELLEKKKNNSIENNGNDQGVSYVKSKR